MKYHKKYEHKLILILNENKRDLRKTIVNYVRPFINVTLLSFSLSTLFYFLQHVQSSLVAVSVSAFKKHSSKKSRWYVKIYVMCFV